MLAQKAKGQVSLLREALYLLYLQLPSNMLLLQLYNESGGKRNKSGIVKKYKFLTVISEIS